MYNLKKIPEVDAKERTSVITEQQPIEGEKQKRVASSLDTDLNHEMKPVEKQSPITAPKASVYKYENDWFDKILDFFATIVGGVAGENVDQRQGNLGRPFYRHPPGLEDG